MSNYIPKNFKFSKSILPLLLLSYITPSLFFGPFCLYIGAVTKEEYWKTITDPVINIFFIVLLAFGFIAYFSFKHFVLQYDGSEKSAKTISTIVRLMEIFAVAAPALFYSSLPFILNARNAAKGLEYVAFEGASPTYTWLSVLLGLTGSYTLLMDVCFMHKIEKSLTWLPYKKEYHALTLVERIVVVPSLV